MNTFTEIGLPEILTQSLTDLNITTPTPIQAQTIPLALEGKDILGSAQTGTGKTLAFTAPMLVHLLNNPQAVSLVLVPTRELAQQVMDTIRQILGAKSPLKSAVLIGGDPIFKQMKQLKANPRVIVGTPGRVIDHLKRRTFQPHNVQFLVLDEMDRMFDMGFGIQLEQIISCLPEKRQNLMFSATLSSHIAKLAAKYLNNPERIAVGSVTSPIARIKQEVIKVSQAEKYGTLLGELEARQGSIIVFVKTKSSTEELVERLIDKHHSAAAIHGDLRQSKRQSVINSFHRGDFRIMVATDVAARGLDIPHIQHVINYDLPQCPEDYIHRIGRTGRAGAEGAALCLISPQDGRKWQAIDRLINPGKKSEPMAFERSEKSRGGKSRAERSWSDKPRSDRPKFGSSWGDKAESAGGRSGKPKFEKSWSGKSDLERSHSDRPFADRPKKSFGGKPGFGKPDFERSASDRPFADRPKKSFGGKPGFGKPDFERSASDRPFADRPKKSFGGKPGFGKPDFERSTSDRPFADRPKKSFGGKPGFGKPDFQRSASDRPFADRPKKSFGGKPGFGKPGAAGGKPGMKKKIKY